MVRLQQAISSSFPLSRSFFQILMPGKRNSCLWASVNESSIPMNDPINLALRREIKRAVAEALQQSEARRPCLPIKKATGIAMARARVPDAERPLVANEVCREGLRLRLVLEFG